MNRQLELQSNYGPPWRVRLDLASVVTGQLSRGHP